MLNRTYSPLAALAACTVLAACAGTESAMREKGMTPLSGPALASALGNGKPITFRSTSTGHATVVNYHPNGSGNLDWGSGTDTGNWRIDGNTLCAKWKIVRDGKEGCFRGYRIGEGEYAVFLPDGTRYGTMTTTK